MAQAIDRQGLDTLFVKARSLRKWQDRPVPDALLRRVFELAILGPTAPHGCARRGDSSGIGADGRRLLRYSDGVHGPSLEWEGMLR